MIIIITFKLFPEENIYNTNQIQNFLIFCILYFTCTIIIIIFLLQLHLHFTDHSPPKSTTRHKSIIHLFSKI